MFNFISCTQPPNFDHIFVRNMPTPTRSQKVCKNFKNIFENLFNFHVTVLYEVAECNTVLPPATATKKIRLELKFLIVGVVSAHVRRERKLTKAPVIPAAVYSSANANICVN